MYVTTKKIKELLIYKYVYLIKLKKILIRRLRSYYLTVMPSPRFIIHKISLLPIIVSTLINRSTIKLFSDTKKLKRLQRSLKNNIKLRNM